MSDPKDQEKEKPSADLPRKATPEERDAALRDLYPPHTIERLSEEFKDKLLENYDSDNLDPEFVSMFFCEWEQVIISGGYEGSSEESEELDMLLFNQEIPERLLEPDPESDDYDPDVPYIDESYFEDEFFEILSTIFDGGTYEAEAPEIDLEYLSAAVAGLSSMFPEVEFTVTFDAYDLGILNQTYKNGDVVSQRYEGPEPGLYYTEEDYWYDENEDDEDNDEDGDDEDNEEKYDQEEDDEKSEDSAEDEEGGEKKES